MRRDGDLTTLGPPFFKQFLEPPTPERIERHLRAALTAHDDRLCAAILDRLSPDARAALDDLLSVEADPAGRSALADLKLDAGPLTVETVAQEATKLARIRRLGLPPDLFAVVPPRLVERFRRRVVAEELYELRRHPTPHRLTLLAAFCYLRARELTDTLAEILIDAIQHIHVRAERRVERALLRDLKRVTGKTNLLYHIAEAAVAYPDGVIRDVIFPAAGGEQTLHDLVRKYKSTGSAYTQRIYTVMRASYSAHYRRIVPLILTALEFRSNNDAHRPVIEALALLARYAAAPITQPYFTLGEAVPLDGVVRPAWRELVVEQGKDGRERVNRINYEIRPRHMMSDTY